MLIGDEAASGKVLLVHARGAAYEWQAPRHNLKLVRELTGVPAAALHCVLCQSAGDAHCLMTGSLASPAFARFFTP